VTLEFDTTRTGFRDRLPEDTLDIRTQAAAGDGYVAVPTGFGPGVAPDRDSMRRHSLDRGRLPRNSAARPHRRRTGGNMRDRRKPGIARQ